MKTLQLSRLWNASVAGAQRIKRNETELCVELNSTLNTQLPERIFTFPRPNSHPPTFNHQSKVPDAPWSLFSSAAKTPACNVHSIDLRGRPYLHQNTVSMITPHSYVRKPLARSSLTWKRGSVAKKCPFCYPQHARTRTKSDQQQGQMTRF